MSTFETLEPRDPIHFYPGKTSGNWGMLLQLHVCSITSLHVAVEWFSGFLDLRWFMLLIPLKTYLLKQPIRQTPDLQKQQLKWERPSELH